MFLHNNPKSCTLSTLKVRFKQNFQGIDYIEMLMKTEVISMDWSNIGNRIRKQREYLGYTREALAEKIDITPKFCSDIELGLKGMSVQTLCRLSEELNLTTDYILFGTYTEEFDSPAICMLQKCPSDKLYYLENIIKLFIQSLDKVTE